MKKEKATLHYGMSLRLYFDEKAFGPGVATLLRNVEKKGSLLGAAKEMNMSYSKAWNIIKNLESEWHIKITDRETGGKGGGGSTLTPKAKRLLERYEKFNEEGRKQLDALFEQYFNEEWIRSLQEEEQEKQKD